MLDSDSAGRAVPELEMTLLNAAGIRISPVMLAARSQPGTDKFNYSCIQDDVAVQAEQAARELIGSSMFNETAVISCYSAACPDISQEHVNSGSLWTAEDVGRLFENIKLGDRDLDEFVRFLGNLGLEAYNLCAGELVDKREKSGGFDIGDVTIRDDDGQECWIYFKNENLLAWDVQKEAPLAMGPDSICYLNLDSGLPFPNTEIMGEVMPGAKIGVIGIKALPGMRNSRFINFFMESIHDFQPIPKYTPIEELQ